MEERQHTQEINAAYFVADFNDEKNSKERDEETQIT